ncbi:condensation domain-containing protein [Streptomyces sp. NPDC048514]|uniref:condensation domain-containing protein n=1 Tax=Streptomyces sp. NPDC048514 TaxID=3365564 RepID=UPI00371A3845
MRISDIQRCDVRPGRLVEWTFSRATVEAAAVLPRDPRPPAYVQESHIRTARSVREGGLFVPTWLGAAFDLPCRADLDVLEGALCSWTLRHETLRSGFRWSGDDVCRFTLGEGDVALHREVVGDFTDAEVLVRYLQDRFDAAADALGWPNLMYAAVVREDSTSVYVAFDHTNVDAYSLQRIPDEIHELYAAGCAGRSVVAVPVGSYVDFCEQERADADSIDDTHVIVTRWREFIGRCEGRLPQFPLDLGVEAGGVLPTQKLVREPLVDADAAAAFEAYCRRWGGSLVGLLAATSLIVHELGGQPVYRTVVPFHTRVRSAWSDSVGWYVGGAPIEVPAAGDFEEALALVRAQLRANRSLARVPLARVLRLLGEDFRPTSPDMYSIISYLDARLVPGSAHWGERKAYGLIRVSYGDQVCVWVNRLHEGLWLACRYPDTGIAYKNVCLYVERLRELILSVSARTRVSSAASSSAGR